MYISVIICSHNPKSVLLQRVLNALENQTLGRSGWELLIIDNGSNPKISEILKVDWHEHFKLIVENKLGLTHARLRGIKESKGDLLVFVDDDNIVSDNYLEKAKGIAIDFPCIGAFGGSCIGEFEVTPPSWFHTSILGIRNVNRDQWSNSISMVEDCPIGAGLAVRRNVAERYVANCENDPMRKSLDRVGNSLMGAGDFDFAYTACDLGLGRGVFKELMLTHVIPKERLTEEYFLRMKEGIACSLVLLFSIRNGKPKPYKRSFKKNVVDYLNLFRMKPMQRKIFQAKRRGHDNAIKILYQ